MQPATDQLWLKHFVNCIIRTAALCLFDLNSKDGFTDRVN